MKKLIYLLILVALYLTLSNGCKKEECYNCTKEVYATSPHTLEDLYNQTKTTVYKTVCSEEEAYELLSFYWNCTGIEKPQHQDEPNRHISLKLPANNDTYIPVNDTLKWSDHINWYGHEYDDLTGIKYYLYLDTISNPEKIVNNGELDLFYVLNVENNKTYYWKVAAINQNGDLSESDIWKFTSGPEITYGSFIDNRDGKEYKTVSIGDNTWMAENLAYEIEGKGVFSDSTWSFEPYEPIDDQWCYYDYDKDSLGEIYGVLYQALAAQIACPSGWHTPSREEWEFMIDYLGDNPGEKLREAGGEHWNYRPQSPGNNHTGFTALPGGNVDCGNFRGLRGSGSWWTSTETEKYYTHSISIDNNYSGVWLGGGVNRYGYSVRCIKDE